MSDAPIPYHPIGMIHSEHGAAEETFIQPAYAQARKRRAEVFPAFADVKEGTARPRGRRGSIR